MIIVYNTPLMNRIQLWKLLVLCVASALGNVVLSYFITDIPLYLDTVFTAAVCFAAGLLPGLLTGALLTPLCFLLIGRRLLGFPVETDWAGYIFTLCVIAEIILVCFYHARMKEREAEFLKAPSLTSFIGVASHLLVLVAVDCIVISIMGGIIDYFITMFSMPRAYYPEDTFKLGLLRNNVPVLAAAVFSRIPINIVDRFIVIFGGYGISLLYRKMLQMRNEK
jgi:hypothetical protein